MSFGPGFPYLPPFSAPQLILSNSLALQRPTTSSSTDSANNNANSGNSANNSQATAGGVLPNLENSPQAAAMSAETLRFLAANHGFPPHLLPAAMGGRLDPTGSGLSGLDSLRALPPGGLPPLGLYPGLGGPGGPVDLGHGQGALPPYYYDACFGAPYPYGDRFGNALDLNGARRKNATRETTAALKAWLYEHRKNPYPTKGEKIMLAIITKMTLTQVSTWFANARRRLKKENKMTWSPRNRSGEDDDDDQLDVDHNQTGVDSSDRPDSNQSSLLGGNDVGRSDDENDDDVTRHKRSHHEMMGDSALINNPTSKWSMENRLFNSSTIDANNRNAVVVCSPENNNNNNKQLKSDNKDEPTSPTKKPKIWSIAETVSSSPCPSTSSANNQQRSIISSADKSEIGNNSATGSANLQVSSSNGNATPVNNSNGNHGNVSSLPTPYITFPPWPHPAAAAAAAAMFARPPMFSMPPGVGGPGNMNIMGPQFLPLMAPRPEFFFRNFMPPSLPSGAGNLPPGLLTFGAVSPAQAAAFVQFSSASNNSVPPPAVSSHSSSLARTTAANNNNSLSPLSLASNSNNSAGASSPENVNSKVHSSKSTATPPTSQNASSGKK